MFNFWDRITDESPMKCSPIEWLGLLAANVAKTNLFQLAVLYDTVEFVYNDIAYRYNNSLHIMTPCCKSFGPCFVHNLVCK